MRLTLRHALAVVTYALAGCNANDATPAASTGPGTDSRLILTLSVQADTIPEATSKTLTARVTDQTGYVKPASVSWTSTDPGIVSVSNGLVTGVSRGAASIIASTTGAADTALIVVSENDLTLDVQPSAAAVAMGDTVNFVATVRTRSGDIIAVNAFNWSASDTAAAQFVGAGALQTKREAELSVSAEALARQGTSTVKIFRTPVASVTISPGTANVYRGASLHLAVTLRDRNGRLVEDQVTWGSTDFTKATVTRDGLVTGVGVGTVIITATANDRTGSATVNVLSPPAAAVQLTLPSTTMLVGTEMQATATPTDSSGQPLSGKTIGWQSANPSIATVTSSGKVKGIAEGSVGVSAIVDGVVATQRVAVKGQQATSMTISPASPSVTAGQQSQLVARVFDQTGGEIPGQAVSWTSSNPGVATISAAGLLQGVTPGSSVITATSGGLTASATASVVSAPVASVRITPGAASLSVGGQTTLSAEALDANQNVLPGRVVTWSSQNPTVATVSNAGLVSAIASGSTALVATIEGKSASVSVTVNPAPLAAVAAVAVSLANPVLDVGGQTQATARLTDASGNTLTGRTITWFSLDTAVAKVSATGLVTASAGGTVAIMARSENVSGSSSLTVNTPTAAPVASLKLDVPSQYLRVGEQIQTVVTMYDATGKVLSGRTITYTSDNPGVITVSATGVIKGVGAGVTKMRASSGGVSLMETFTVTAPATLASISVTPASASLTVGQTSQATATARDAQGAIISGTSFTWTTSNAAVATVTSTGLVSAIGAGSATIHAAAAGVTGSMAVSVSGSTPSTSVASVSMSLSPSSILVGGTTQATAVAKDAQGAVIAGKAANWSVSNSLATVSSSGLVTALAAGTVLVTANIDGKSASGSLTISNPPTQTTPSAGAELPRTFLNYSLPATTGQIIVVPAGGNLQTALNNAQRGDEIVLAAGATYTGNFTLPAKPGSAANGWIKIRTDKHSQLPAIGTRVHASNAALMPKVVTPNTAPAIRLAAGASGWWISGIEVTVTASVTQQQYGLIFLGESRDLQTTMASVPQDVVLDRMYIHGQPTTNLSRCVALNSGRTQISDSYIVECHGKGFDSQAVAGWNGPGPYKIVNNALQGAGENLMFGGSDPGIPGLVPSDIEIRRNHLYTPVAWKGVWTKKNLFETKNAVRVLVEGNVMDGSWGDGQNGEGIVLKSSNQSGGCLWCRTTDVTFRRNLIRNVSTGFNLAARDTHTPVDTVLYRVDVSENVIEVAAHTGTYRGFQIIGGPHTIRLHRNVLTGPTPPMQAFIITSQTNAVYGLTVDSLVASRGQYGMIGDNYGPGEGAWNGAVNGPKLWRDVWVLGANNGTYPPGTTFSTNEPVWAAGIRNAVASATAGVAIP